MVPSMAIAVPSKQTNNVLMGSSVSEQILALWHVKMLASLCHLSPLSPFPFLHMLVMNGIRRLFSYFIQKLVGTKIRVLIVV